LIDLTDHLPAARVVDLVADTKAAALEELVRTLGGAPEVRDVDGLLAAVLEREDIVSTGVGLGLAVPHAKIDSVTDFVLAYGRSCSGIPFDSLDDAPVRHIVLIAGPSNQQQRYLQFLATVMLKLKQSGVRDALEAASGATEMRAAIID
jgi:nitrogen PTS system EIIA component